MVLLCCWGLFELCFAVICCLGLGLSLLLFGLILLFIMVIDCDAGLVRLVLVVLNLWVCIVLF